MLKKIAATTALALAATGMASSAAQAAPLATKDVVYETNEEQARLVVDQVKTNRAPSQRWELRLSLYKDDNEDGVYELVEREHIDYARKGFRVLRFVVEPQHNQARVDLEVKRKNTKKYREAHFIARDALNAFVPDPIRSSRRPATGSGGSALGHRGTGLRRATRWYAGRPLAG